MTEILAPLTRDETTCLIIMRNGDYLAPIGRWGSALDSLEKRGYARKFNDVNYGITTAGHQACDASEDQAMRDLIDYNNAEYFRQHPEKENG